MKKTFLKPTSFLKLTSFLKPTPFQFILMTAITAVAISLAGANAAAEGSWLDKGASILKGMATDSKAEKLSTGEIGGGLRDALRVGTERVVQQLAKPDGYNADPTIHIPLPEQFSAVKSVLDKIGMGGLLADLELKLNRAAEAATPKAKKHFWEAIEQMTFEDARAIYEGPEDSATKYFQGKMTPPLTEEIRPVIENSLSEVGAIQAYDTIMQQYQSVPFVPNVKANLTDYTIEKGLAGLFHYIGLEEAAIRKDPAKRSTELLKRVFGTN